MSLNSAGCSSLCRKIIATEACRVFFLGVTNVGWKPCMAARIFVVGNVTRYRLEKRLIIADIDRILGVS
jgi:hypothetical protein